MWFSFINLLLIRFSKDNDILKVGGPWAGSEPWVGDQNNLFNFVIWPTRNTDSNVQLPDYTIG